MPSEFRYDVFISHSAKDKAAVRPLAERLRADGLKVWFDKWGLPSPAGAGEGGRRPRGRRGAEADGIPGEIAPHPLPGHGETREGLERSRVLVLCLSAQAFGSDWAQLHTDSRPSTLNPQPTCAPLNRERRFIPLRLDDAPIKVALAQFLYLMEEQVLKPR
jgi:hypothetical protein